MKLIPELRFQEFEDDGAWVKQSIEDIAKVTTGNKDTQDKIDDGKYPFFVRSQTIEKINSFSYDGEAILTSGDGVGVGKIYHYIIGKFDFHQRVYCIYGYEEDIEGKFVFYFFSKHFYNRVMRLSAKNSVDSVRKAMITEMPIIFPPTLQEQQKIASCLSSLDELIAAHSDKLETLKDHKKGLMQNLFPQKGQKVPNYRFLEFEDDGEWSEKTVRQVYDFKVTNSFSRAKLNYESGSVKNIHYGDIHTKFSTLFDITKETVPFINADVPIDKIINENYCIEGDMIFADASEDIDDVGKSIEIINLNKEKLLAGLHTLLARQIKPKLTKGFAGYLFKADNIRNQIKREAQGAKVLGISAGRISNVKIYYPKSTSEQQKIASCLSALDELITAQSDKIEQLQQHKKGLMQGLFPKI